MALENGGRMFKIILTFVEKLTGLIDLKKFKSRLAKKFMKLWSNYNNSKMQLFQRQCFFFSQCIWIGDNQWRSIVILTSSDCFEIVKTVHQHGCCKQKNLILFRSGRPELFCKKGVLRNFAKFTGKHLCQRFFFN